MFIAKSNSFNRAEKIVLDTLDVSETALTGLIAGTQVETAKGWRGVETLCAGDQVFTYDGALRPVLYLNRQFVSQSEPLVHIPGGVMSNSDDLLVMPDQKLLIESRLAGEMFGRANVLVSARDLVGNQGISNRQTDANLQLLQPVFADDEIIWANSGLLFQCAAEQGDDFYTAPNAQDAQMFVARVLDDARLVA